MRRTFSLQQNASRVSFRGLLEVAVSKGTWADGRQFERAVSEFWELLSSLGWSARAENPMRFLDLRPRTRLDQAGF